MWAVALLLLTVLPSDGFYPIGEAHGVKVYRRDGQRGIELAAEGDFEASPEQVQRLLLDYPNHTRWVKGLRESRVLRTGDHSLEVYQRLELPFLDDRDFTLHVTWGAQGEVRWLQFATQNEAGPPPTPGVVRVPMHEGSWRLIPIAGGKATHAIYQFHMDLGGSFPSWMGKGRAGKDLPALFENIRHQLR